MSDRLEVLVSPLDWGLGHATRLIPVIRLLLQEKHHVILAGDRSSLDLLKIEFPSLEWIRLLSTRVSYSKNRAMIPTMILFLPEFLRGIILEHRHLKSILRKHTVDVVISDNRYGLWNKKVYSILLTHQYKLIMPRGLRWMESLVHWIIRALIHPFDECWIPDHAAEPSLSGSLSHDYTVNANVSYIGPLSRFPENETPSSRPFLYDVLILLSGPESQRTVLEEKLIAHPALDGKKVFLVRGIPDDGKLASRFPSWKIAGRLNSQEVYDAVRRSEFVICRAGYSSIMDLVAIKKMALLIPTPGQTEQEYLARHGSSLGLFCATTQKELALEKFFQSASDFQPAYPFRHGTIKLEEKISGLARKVISPEKEQSAHHNYYA